MRSVVTRRVFGGLLCLLFAACGGGGSGGSDSGGGAPNHAPVAHILGAPSITATTGLPLTLDGSGSTDADNDALTYSWTLTSQPAGGSDQLWNLGGATSTFLPSRDGTYVVSLTVSDGKATTVTSLTIVASIVADTAIVLNQTEPVADMVRLSLNGQVLSVAHVLWYVDAALIGDGAGATDRGADWDAFASGNGTHLVVVRITYLNNVVQELQRTVSVANSSINMTVALSGHTGLINVDVVASSPSSVARVTAQLDGANIGSLDTPNVACSSCTGGLYRFVIDAAAIGSGNHSVLVTATDGWGGIRRITSALVVANPPSVSLTSPDDGVFVYGVLQITGTATTDKPLSHVAVQARVGSAPIFTTTGGAFDWRYDLASLAPGSYVLNITATDDDGLVSQVNRTIVVASSAAMVKTPDFVLPSGGTLLVTEGSQVVVRNDADHVVVLDSADGSSTPLLGAAAFSSSSSWQMNGGWIYAQAQGSDCTSYCVYRWATDGTAVNLSGAGQTGSAIAPVAHDGYVAWHGSASTFTVYNATTGAYTAVNLPAGVTENNSADIAAASGVVHRYFESPSVTYTDLYHWRSDSGTVQRITGSDQMNAQPRTDGSRVAWLQGAGPPTSQLRSLLTLPITDGVPAVVSTHVQSHLLANGVLAWQDGTGATSDSAVRLQLADGITQTLSVATPVALLANASGRVLFGEQGRLYSWNSATATRSLVVDGIPDQTLPSGNTATVRFGPRVYRLLLD